MANSISVERTCISVSDNYEAESKACIKVSSNAGTCPTVQGWITYIDANLEVPILQKMEDFNCTTYTYLISNFQNKANYYTKMNYGDLTYLSDGEMLYKPPRVNVPTEDLVLCVWASYGSNTTEEVCVKPEKLAVTPKPILGTPSEQYAYNDADITIPITNYLVGESVYTPVLVDNGYATIVDGVITWSFDLNVEYGRTYTLAFRGYNNCHSESELCTIEMQVKETIWEVISHQNVGTCSWRVTVRNTTTLEEKSGVYPFNLLSTHVYMLLDGSWVLASLGGTQIISSWDGKKDSECLKLIGTDEKISMEGLGSFTIYYMLPTFAYNKDGTRGSAPSIHIRYVYDNINMDLAIAYNRPDGPDGIIFYDNSVNVGNSSNLAIAFTDLMYSLFDNLYNLCVSYNQLSYTYETWSLADYNTVINLHSNVYLESLIFSDFIASPRYYGGSQYGNIYSYPLYKYK